MQLARMNFRGLLLPLLLLFALSPCAQPTNFALNIFPDNRFAPFVFGVASGDPLPNSVMLWTKLRVSDTTTAYQLKWQIAEDERFGKIVSEGSVLAEYDNDFTVKVDATGLKAGGSYFYRFEHNGIYSAVGKARTLPDEDVEQLKLAVASCSSIWSGFFNAYRRISERPDVDFVVHLGDYVYDYADKDERFRIVAGAEPKDVSSLREWRERHTYYLLDPDLRAARQQKTWIVMWDNHDTDCEKPGTQADAIRAFYEYLPIRPPDTARPDRLYRSFRFGALAQLNMIDMLLFRGKEFYEEGKKSVLGNEQDAWLKSQLKNASSVWNLIGSQEMMGGWMKSKGAKILNLPGNELYFDPGGWDGYPHDRERLYDFLKENNINNTVVLSGDMHMSFIIDLTPFPKDKRLYNKRTGEGAVGVEFLPTSITRGNMDESGVPKELIPMFQGITKSWNRHHLFNQFTKHGYGTLHITKTRCVAEFWYVPILSIQKEEFFGRGYTVKNGANHWERNYNKRRSKSTYPLR